MTAIRPITKQEMASLISLKIRPTISDKHEAILQRSVSNSAHLWVGENDGEVLCFFGLIPPTLLSDTAYLWLYTTPQMKGHTIPLIRGSIRLVNEWLSLYDSIVGHGRDGDTRSLAWLKKLGAKFYPPEGGVVAFEIRAS